jgi:hypothetical protein
MLNKRKGQVFTKGNEAFEEKNYVDAEADYRISQSKFPKKLFRDITSEQVFTNKNKLLKLNTNLRMR